MTSGELSVGATTPDGADVWAITLGEVGRLIAITDEAYRSVKLPLDELDQRTNELLVEGVPADVLFTKGTKIPLKKIMLVTGDEKKCSITLGYMKLAGPVSYKVTAPNIDAQREILDSLRRRLGTNARYKRKEFTPLRAAVGPIVLGLLTCLLTLLFASEVLFDENYQPSGSRRASKEMLSKIIEALGPTGVLIVGGLVLIGCIWWGVRRVKNPPIIVTIKPGKFPKS